MADDAESCPADVAIVTVTRRHRAASRRRTLAVAVLVTVPAACGNGADSEGTTGETVAEPVTTPVDLTTSAPPDCLVRIHGKGGTGSETTASTTGGQTLQIVSPTGNADGWGGRQWLYFPDDSYTEARDTVDDATAACARIVLNGFSNGAAFVGKLYCRGETFDERLVGVVIDDPVTDEGTAGCAPPPDIEIALYWTGALTDQASIGVNCADIDWTCDGETVVGIDEYAARLGVEITPSPFQDHAWYTDAPETTAWFAG